LAKLEHSIWNEEPAKEEPSLTRTHDTVYSTEAAVASTESRLPVGAE
jgi:hypothetical protein